MRPPSRILAVLLGTALLGPGLAGPAFARRPAPSLLTVKYPGKTWSVVVDLRSFDLQRPLQNPDGSAVTVRGRNRHEGLTVSVFMEKAAKDGDALVCRKHYMKLAKQSPLPKDDVKLSERDGLALVEYTIPEYQGVEINQKNLNAYLVREDIWIAIQVAKRRLKPDDDELLEKVLQAIRFKEVGTRRRIRYAPLTAAASSDATASGTAPASSASEEPTQ
jgi:hypothetical protein